MSTKEFKDNIIVDFKTWRQENKDVNNQEFIKMYTNELIQVDRVKEMILKEYTKRFLHQLNNYEVVKTRIDVLIKDIIKDIVNGVLYTHISSDNNE